MNVGNKIRMARKNLGINMKDFARKIGVSYITLYRVETDKVSPSVALLSEIAHHLGEPITSFFSEERPLTLVKSGTAAKVEGGKLTLEVLVPKGVISDKISVTLGRAEQGEFVSRHAHRGFELTYNLKGAGIFKYDNVEYEFDPGDLLYFDASIEHSVRAIERHEFFSVYFRS
ncbi:MAG: helix-turn-helix domain-containing protein [Deltaproteobacteria bacterium]|nr:helix-turn-helix domain-containing protein [Deltaproteobacteria bacterium]